MVAGHSLGEFSALVSAGYLSFEDGLKLVSKREFNAKRLANKIRPQWHAVLGLENEVVEKICDEIKEIVVPATTTAQDN